MTDKGEKEDMGDYFGSDGWNGPAFVEERCYPGEPTPKVGGLYRLRENSCAHEAISIVNIPSFSERVNPGEIIMLLSIKRTVGRLPQWPGDTATEWWYYSFLHGERIQYNRRMRVGYWLRNFERVL
jgi:hypothetical protein